MTALRLLPMCADRLIEQMRVAVIPRDARVVGVDQHDVQFETPPIVAGQHLVGGCQIAIGAHMSITRVRTF